VTRGTPAADERLRELSTMVEDALGRALPETDDVAVRDAFACPRLIESMRYSLTAPGKRLRPLLLLSAVEAVGGDPKPLACFAVGVELIHAYSLIHDDLPAMDDDELRRGRATNHVVYGEAMAILAGDGLLTEAMVVMLDPVTEPRMQMRVVREIASAAGFHGMVGGQVADMMAEGAEPSEDLLISIHSRKTGALITAAVRAGGLLGGGGDDDLDALTVFAQHYGLAFQIADDIKDEVAPSEVSGKKGGGDRQAGKMTYPALFGIDGARERLNAEEKLALDALVDLGSRGSVLAQLARTSLSPATAVHGD